MIRNRCFRLSGALAAALLSGGCQSYDAAVPAVLDAADSETMARVKTVLAGAVGRAQVELGPGDLTRTPSVSVLPPRPSPYECRSLAAPVLFDIVIKDARCFVVKRDGGEYYALSGVSCRPLEASDVERQRS